MKAILMSIQPKWCYLIAHGDKTIEIRKTKPKLELPFKCYIYKTKYEKRLLSGVGILKLKVGGAVIGSFVCDRVFELKINGDDYGNYWHEWDDEGDIQDMCLSYEELETYLGKSVGYGWHISDLKIYDEPKELSEFRKPCIYHHYCCAWCRFGNIILSDDEEEFALYHGGSYETFDTVCCNYVKRPPQSWCYVEEKDDDKTRT